MICFSICTIISFKFSAKCKKGCSVYKINFYDWYLENRCLKVIYSSINNFVLLEVCKLGIDWSYLSLEKNITIVAVLALFKRYLFCTGKRQLFVFDTISFCLQAKQFSYFELFYNKIITDDLTGNIKSHF